MTKFKRKRPMSKNPCPICCGQRRTFGDTEKQKKDKKFALEHLT